MQQRANLTSRFLLGILYVSIALAVFVGIVIVGSYQKTTKPNVFLGGQEITVSIANTPALQERGLGGRENLGANEGMLFLFQAPSRVGFWMKDMLFPIDIIWFDANLHIVDIWNNASPDSYPEIRTPKANAQYVIEVAAGFSKNHNLKIGDVLELGSASRYTK